MHLFLPEAHSSGKGGDILISASGLFQSDNSTVITSADQAKGGDIALKAAQVQLNERDPDLRREFWGGRCRQYRYYRLRFVTDEKQCYHYRSQTS